MITVYQPGNENSVFHTEGGSLKVENGHLLVLDAVGTVHAIYAPGEWRYAVLGGPAKVEVR